MNKVVIVGGGFAGVKCAKILGASKKVNVTLFNPVVYLVSGFRWSFFGTGDVPVGWSLLAIAAFTGGCLWVIWWIFRTGWRIRQ